MPVVASAGAVAVTPAKAAGPPFASMLSDAIGRVDQSNTATDSAIDRYMSGENDDIHSVVMATQRNELQFEMFLQMRSKVVQAYQEVMRMQM